VVEYTAGFQGIENERLQGVLYFQREPFRGGVKGVSGKNMTNRKL